VITKKDHRRPRIAYRPTNYIKVTIGCVLCRTFIFVHYILYHLCCSSYTSVTALSWVITLVIWIRTPGLQSFSNLDADTCQKPLFLVYVQFRLPPWCHAHRVCHAVQNIVINCCSKQVCLYALITQYNSSVRRRQTTGTKHRWKQNTQFAMIKFNWCSKNLSR
jgi:fumarate reductase subunit D